MATALPYLYRSEVSDVFESLESIPVMLEHEVDHYTGGGSEKSIKTIKLSNM